MRTQRGKSAFTLVETMLMSVMLIIASLGVASMLYKQKQVQVSSQQSITGRKVLTETISKLQAATWQYPPFVLKNASLDPGAAGAASMTSKITLSYVTCYDRLGNPAASMRGDLNVIPVAVDNRVVTGDLSCAGAGGFSGPPAPGPALGGGPFGGGALGTGGARGGSSACSGASMNVSFKLSGFCATPAAEYEVQITPLYSSSSSTWDGTYDVWVISLLSEEQKQKKGIIRHYFREQVLIEQ